MASQNTTLFSASSKPKLQNSRKLLYERTHVIQPKGEHRATIVWLHGRGDVGASWAEEFQEFPSQNIKWIVPTAPMQAITALGGYQCNAWFDGRPAWEGPDDLEGLDASAAHVVELLSKESPNIKLGVGGFSQGAATSLYITACSMIGSYSDGTIFPCKLHITAVLSGWFPCAKNIETRFLENLEAGEQAKGYSIFLAHGTDDQVVPLNLGEKATFALQFLGFDSITFQTYNG
ncbi:hypothetical protein GOP47_0009606 [Adiantum capillus-veneris]|uniref:Phospholipase/carboxylesterase/thioesterase domain-containing protein n=1 Tax=Adiantum capillus-veneris TaxID=13818 RepID=A0A9D4UXB8_ADICA|nr:hypothetical protein GOP47_0009606 [Adiantum capillus-veneris]